MVGLWQFIIQVVDAYSKTNPDLLYVSIGAHDGKTNDPLHALLLKYHWQSIMVEPRAELLDQCRTTYRDLDNITYEQVAIAEHDGIARFYYPETTPQTPAWIKDQLGSLSLYRMYHIRHIGRLITVTVPCLTLASLFSKHQVECVNILKIDTEGYDHKIIKQLDLKQHAPDIIIFEHSHMLIGELAQAIQRLQRHGYHVYKDYDDTVAVTAQVDQVCVKKPVDGENLHPRNAVTPPLRDKLQLKQRLKGILAPLLIKYDTLRQRFHPK